MHAYVVSYPMRRYLSILVSLVAITAVLIGCSVLMGMAFMLSTFFIDMPAGRMGNLGMWIGFIAGAHVIRHKTRVSHDRSLA